MKANLSRMLVKSSETRVDSTSLRCSWHDDFGGQICCELTFVNVEVRCWLLLRFCRRMARCFSCRDLLRSGTCVRNEVETRWN